MKYALLIALIALVGCEPDWSDDYIITRIPGEDKVDTLWVGVDTTIGNWQIEWHFIKGALPGFEATPIELPDPPEIPDTAVYGFDGHN